MIDMVRTILRKRIWNIKFIGLPPGSGLPSWPSAAKYAQHQTERLQQLEDEGWHVFTVLPVPETGGSDICHCIRVVAYKDFVGFLDEFEAWRKENTPS